MDRKMVTGKDPHSLLCLNAIGPLSLTDCDGHEYLPGGNKARALIVLLAVAPGFTRSRQWLQSKLWSDRSTAQASGSLRSTLSEIRKALGPYAAALEASRQSVSFRTDMLEVSYARPDGVSFDECEPFEGVDARDPEFEHLIRDVRSRILDDVEAALKPVLGSRPGGKPLRPDSRRMVIVRKEVRGAPPAAVAAQLLHDRISQELRGNTDLEIVEDGASGGAADILDEDVNCVRFKIMSVASDNEAFLSCEAELPSTGKKLWSNNIIAPISIEDLYASPRLTSLVQQAIEVLIRALYGDASGSRTSESAWLLSRQAKDLIFRLDRPNLVEADRLLRRAYEMEPRGRFLAWRGFLRNLAFFQHRTDGFFEEYADPDQLSLEALRDSPDDPEVLTISSQLEYINQGDPGTSLRIVERSAEIDPTHPMTWAVMSNALIAGGRCEEGYQAAQKALNLSVHSKNQFFFEHFACMAAVACQDYDAALSHAGMALLYRPEFVSTRRYQVALSLQKGDRAATLRSSEALQSVEPDFTISKLLDPAYPVTTLRRLPLIDAISKLKSD